MNSSRRHGLFFCMLLILLSFQAVLLGGCGSHSSQGTDSGEYQPEEVPELTEEQIAEYVSADGFVDPAAYGAKGDGVTDDSEALQMAIDSGYNVRLQDTTYFIAADRMLNITEKNGFHMEGGTIHKEASPSNYHLFVLTDCTDCSFSGMSIVSEFTCKDILVPNNHFRPSDTLSSNVLAFSGTGNTDILFQNNTFDHMGSDYWFNATDDAFWQNVTVDGWTSSSSLLPMYTQCLEGLTVRNASVSLNPGCGDGDHCIYVCYRTSDVLIEDSAFNGNDSDELNGAVVVLTFHGGDVRNDSEPKNITIRSCSIDARSGRALYCEEGTDITVSDCSIVQTPADSVGQTLTHEKTPIFGYGDYSFSDCTIGAVDRVFEDIPNLVLNNCTVTGAAENTLIANVNNVSASGCTFTANGGGAVYMKDSSKTDHLYENCTFVKTGDARPYLFSDCSRDGSVVLRNCSADLAGQWFSYNGEGKDSSGYVLENTDLENCAGMDLNKGE